jgi:hypothetical protein
MFPTSVARGEDTYSIGSLRKSLSQSLKNPCHINYSYLNTRDHPKSKEDNRKICSKNCDKACTGMELQ